MRYVHIVYELRKGGLVQTMFGKITTIGGGGGGGEGGGYDAKKNFILLSTSIVLIQTTLYIDGVMFSMTLGGWGVVNMLTSQ